MDPCRDGGVTVSSPLSALFGSLGNKMDSEDSEDGHNGENREDEGGPLFLKEG